MSYYNSSSLQMIRRSSIAVGLMFSTMLGCDRTVSHSNPAPTPQSQVEQDLPITFGGFIHNGPEEQKLDGQCRPNITRDVLQCDIHNGLIPWNITELTFQVIRHADPESEHHYYRERVPIGSLQTETVIIKLGMQLPADTNHWSWLVVDAEGT